MELIGTVKAILNDQLILILSDTTLKPDELISVFFKIETPDLADKGLSEPIYYPKGQLRVICKQTGNQYLTERFREVNKRTRTEIIPSPFIKNLAGLMANIQGETREITEEIPGKWSAEIDGEQNLNISVSEVVSIGDSVGRLL